MDEMRPADYAVLNGNGGFGGGFGGGAWWILLLFVFAMFGWGNGGWGGGQNGGSVKDAYVLSSDFATIQRQMSDGFASQERRTDAIINGISNLGYTGQTLANQTNTNILQTGFGLQNAINGIGSQLQQCCCDNRAAIADVGYKMATNTNTITNAINGGFCDTQYRDLSNTNALMQAGHADADRIIARLDALEANRKDEIIAAQNAKINQYETINAVVNQIKPCPTPAYLTCNPNGPINYAVATTNGCGCA